MPRGYMEGPASEEAERRADELARGATSDLELTTELAVFGSTAEQPETHFLGWRSELDSDELFRTGKAWGLTVRRIAGPRTDPPA